MRLYAIFLIFCVSVGCTHIDYVKNRELGVESSGFGSLYEGIQMPEHFGALRLGDSGPMMHLRRDNKYFFVKTTNYEFSQDTWFDTSSFEVGRDYEDEYTGMRLQLSF